MEAVSRIAPNLDRLAAQSFVFQQAYVTQAICTPSRSSLLTGLWPHTTGCVHNETTLAEGIPCLPQLLGDSDYRWAYFGKWHLGHEHKAQRGFSDWVSIMDRPRDRAADPGTISDYSKYLLARGIKPRRKHSRFFTRADAVRMPLALSQPKFLESRACEFLERIGNNPFVLFVAFFEPHPPYSGPLNNFHPLNEIEPEPTSGKQFGLEIPRRYRLLQKENEAVYGKTTAAQVAVKRRYLGLVSEVDASIGAILNKLESTGLAEHTIVMHTSDHGDMMGAHNLFGKDVLFQEAIRVPLLVRMPGQERAITIAESISHIDFAPTVLELLGKDSGPALAGQSRASVFRGEAMPAVPIYLERSFEPYKAQPVKRKWSKPANELALHETTRATISPSGWKLCLRDQDKNELYNLRADPHEEHNLWEVPAYRSVAMELTDKIYTWQTNVRDTARV